MHPLLVFPSYLLLALAPLVISAMLEYPRRPLIDEISTGIALVGFSVLLIEFSLSGRFRVITRRIGIDATMRLHQLLARWITVPILIHPFLYSLPLGHSDRFSSIRSIDPTALSHLGLEGWSIVTGIVAWLLLAALVLMAVFRDHLSLNYEAWRLSHGLGALIIAGTTAHHAIEAGRYSSHEWLTYFWIAMLALAVLTLFDVYILRPLRKLANPYEINSVRPVALKTWEVRIVPKGESAVRPFLAGQFVWLTLDRSPISIREHPFSISSAPSDRKGLSFLIKEAGDFTSRVGELRAGAQAYFDGPHGNLVLENRSAAGFVFLAGGIGIAPILSIIRELAARGDPRPLTLIYGNRAAEQIVYREELTLLERRLNLKVVFLLREASSNIDAILGEFDTPTLGSVLNDLDCDQRDFVICGPPAMIRASESALAALNVPAKRILAERFSYN